MSTQQHRRGNLRLSHLQLFCLLLTAALVLSACNLPVNSATAEVPPQTEPPTIQAVAAVALEATQTPQVERLPTETPP